MPENQPETPDPARSSGEALFDASALRLPVSNDRDDAAARIAELVRRSNERQSGGAPAPTPQPEAPAPSPAPTPQPEAPATSPAPGGPDSATQAMPSVGGEATRAVPPPTQAVPAVSPEATRAVPPAAPAPTRAVPQVDPEATQAMAPVTRTDTPVPQSSSGAPEVTPVAPLDYDPTVVVPPSAAAAAGAAASSEHTMQLQRPELDQPAAQPEPATRGEAVRPRRSVPSWALVAGALVVILLLVWGFSSAGSSGTSGPAAGKPGGGTAAGAAPAGFQVRLSDTITDCAAHARGKVKASLRDENCVKATRSVGTGTVNGRKVLFVVSRIEMASPDAAAHIKEVLDGDGTGNINDLLREGKHFAGGPRRMPTSGYASVQADEIVGVAEAGYMDGTSSDSDPALRDAAASVAGSIGTH